MPKTLALFASLIFFFAFSATAYAQTMPEGSGPRNSVQYLLPASFSVYTGPGGVMNHPDPGFTKRTLPTINFYVKEDGCYIAVYSHDSKNAVYPLGPDIYVAGQIRVRGTYDNRICQPTGFEGRDISASKRLKRLTKKYFPGRQGGTWPGGDTGGWFGIQ